MLAVGTLVHMGGLVKLVALALGGAADDLVQYPSIPISVLTAFLVVWSSVLVRLENGLWVTFMKVGVVKSAYRHDELKVKDMSP